jgi:hypothetical protein
VNPRAVFHPDEQGFGYGVHHLAGAVEIGESDVEGVLGKDIFIRLAIIVANMGNLIKNTRIRRFRGCPGKILVQELSQGVDVRDG